MLAICEDVQREGYLTGKKGARPSSSTALSSLNSLGFNSAEISATLMLKRVRLMVNVTLVWVLTYL